MFIALCNYKGRIKIKRTSGNIFPIFSRNSATSSYLWMYVHYILSYMNLISFQSLRSLHWLQEVMPVQNVHSCHSQADTAGWNWNTNAGDVPYHVNECLKYVRWIFRILNKCYCTHVSMGFICPLLKLWCTCPSYFNYLHDTCWSPFRICSTYQVWAVGRLPNVGAAVIWKRGLSSAKPPGGSCEQPVVNCSRRAISSCVKFATAVQNQSRMRRNSEELPFTTWWALKSATLYSPVPHSNSCKNKHGSRMTNEWASNQL